MKAFKDMLEREEDKLDKLKEIMLDWRPKPIKIYWRLTAVMFGVALYGGCVYGLYLLGVSSWIGILSALGGMFVAVGFMGGPL